jgi:hypothetical protein
MQCPNLKNTGMSNTLKGSNKGRGAGRRPPLGGQWDETVIMAASPAGRTGLKKINISLRRLAGKDSSCLPRSSRQGGLLVSFTPLEQSFREVEQNETMPAETDNNSVHSVMSVSRGEANNKAMTTTCRKRNREGSGDDPSPTPPARKKKQGRPVKIAKHKEQFTAAKIRERTLQKWEEKGQQGSKKGPRPIVQSGGQSGHEGPQRGRKRRPPHAV